MATIQMIDLDDRRPDYELSRLTISACSFFSVCLVVYLHIDKIYIINKFPHLDLKVLCLTIGLFTAFVWSVKAYARSVSQGRTLMLDLVSQTYEVRAGLLKGVVVCSGRFEDFARVQLERKERQVHGEKYVKVRQFWTVSMVWKAPDQRPICLQERKGESVPPPLKYLRRNPQRIIDQAQADADRWGRDLGVPVIDMVRTLDEEPA
ncbi:MAG: hypothetical protein ABI353_15425 [Isosphaeraceae bacterium]